MERSLGERIIVIGDSNAGKTTLGRRLAEHLGVPFIELDALFWEPGWVEPETAVFRERVRRAIATDAWVVDGNYRSRQQDISWAAADTVVWLDLGLATLVRRCVQRSWRRSRSGDLLWGTNRERFWNHLMLWDPQRSLIAFTIRTHHARRRDYEAAVADPRWSHVTFIRLRSRREVDDWLGEILTPLPDVLPA